MKNAYEHYMSLPDDSQEQECYFELCSVLMEDELRENLSTVIFQQDEFLKCYCENHLRQFGKEFIVN